MPRRSVVDEVVTRVSVNGRPVAVWTASPGRPDALAAGWLLAEGFIQAPADIERLDADEQPGRLDVHVQVDEARATAALTLRAHRLEHGCGARHFLDCDPSALRSRGGTRPPPDAERMQALFRELFAAEDDARGGVHIAALSDGMRLLEPVTEIGRHNAVDRAIGAAMLANEELARLGLVLSARVSGEIALKAARAGLRWIASRSIPSTLAVEVAQHAGVAIIARAAGPEALVHG